MITLQNGNEILPNWVLQFDEVSNNVYKVELIDAYGRLAATTDHNLERAIKTCEGYAFDIEKQISKHWSRFLFNYSMLKLQGLVTFSSGDPNNAYGSWGISVKDKILTYDGRDNVLVSRVSTAEPFAYNAISVKDISFETFIEYIEFIKKES